MKYTSPNMRFVPNAGKGLDKNPDRFGTIHGTFTDESGNVLAVKSKVITLADAKNPITVIDIANGVLVLPSGERGRKPSVGASQDNIDALLNSLREDSAS